ncbi:hypothetical protein G7K_6060-t1 [Saitoella complicata NRRL Y-17804]|uniref:Uncharacterized protein n=1 Tax=Saitoella complicata (strain BCRC 22490 / CBS 7301 / JCM 7358 / NBRC 10748 / NRRL Y-17804) TaxID=698492 RepID=A0A0E9NQ26_SAICN|nr:hypothetical protein G7K_6060-t1 [Saitoella complicata NRRL Y-17804]
MDSAGKPGASLDAGTPRYDARSSCGEARCLWPEDEHGSAQHEGYHHNDPPRFQTISKSSNSSPLCVFIQAHAKISLYLNCDS